MNLSESEAKVKRRIIKASATRLKNYIESPQVEHATKFELIERKNKLVSLFEQYDEVQTRLECLKLGDEASESNVLTSHDEDRTRFEEAYFHLVATYEQRLSQFEHRDTAQATNSTNVQIPRQNNSDSHLRLQKIELPVFSGLYENWYTFYDSFDKLIHSNNGLSAIQKFHYLRSSLKDKAAEVVKSFDITADNYAEAWQLLIDRFDNKRRIVQTHIKAMFDIAPVHKENCAVLRSLLDNVFKHFRALRALQRPVDNWDDMIIHLVLTKLDSVTVKEWETSRSDATIPTFKQLTDFLSKRCQALEAISSKSAFAHPNSSMTNNSQKARLPSSHVITSNQSCVHCKESHFIFQCESFRKLPTDKRFKIIKNAHLCINCLKVKGHQAKDCPSGSCRKCGKAHNTLLHFESSNNIAPNTDKQPCSPSLDSKNAASSNCSSPVVTQCTQVSSPSRIYLSTAIVNIYDCKGKTHSCRALLDNGSQLSFITERLANKLQLKGHPIKMSISGVAERLFESKRLVRVKYQSKVNAYLDNIDCIVLPRITQRLPQEFCPISKFKIPSNIVLADPNFNVPADIDMLIGAQSFWQLLCVGQIKACEAHPTLQKTKLGWIISGIVNEDSNEIASASCHVTTVEELDKSIARFWEIEHDVSSNNTSHYTPEERACEIHFQQNTVCNSAGRFIVKLPANEEKIQQLGDSRESARRRFFNLERRLLTQSDMHSEYQRFMQEYIDLGHMREVREIRNGEVAYYLPHHAVLKESTTTKLRVVFDASNKSTSGLSLNDALLVGPTIQQDLFSILARFRTFYCAMTADVTKMYRQVLVDESQTLLQHIFWRNSLQNELKTFELLMLTYGTAPASFLAIRSIRKLAESEADSFPLGSKIILRDFYVDDMLTGASTIEEASEIKRQAIKLLSKGGFELRKWSSNHPSLQDSEGPCGKKLNLASDRGSEIKALGIIWNCESDAFKFLSVGHLPPLENPTKHGILSRIALVFDPLGLLGPSTLIAKILMQELWRAKVNWDESVSSELHMLWREYELKLQTISNIEITRKIIPYCEVQRAEIHGFSDASQKAYGACIYVRSISVDGQSAVYLLCSKSRVAPLRTLTIPRLELCGALLLTQLTKKVSDSLPFKVDSTYLWTDSSIVLCWLRSCSRQWTPFVVNRVAEIQRITEVANWRHVPTHDNPADVLSRGIMPDLLYTLDIWWSGPAWLRLSEREWPSESFIAADIELPENRAMTLVAAIKTESRDNIFVRFSRLFHLIRTIAFCLRFIKNCKMKGINKLSSDTKLRHTVQTLSTEELERSRLTLIRMVQYEAFKTEIHSIEKTNCVNKNSHILKLNPFIDSCGVLRVGGRLKHANVPYEYKHPILLPGKHPFTRLIIVHEHERHLHAGNQATLAAVRQNYWPTSARNIIRHIVKGCMKCVHSSPKPGATLMADLPEARVNVAKYAFEKCGVDYAGPFWYKGQRKNSRTVKCYIALFVCLATKAVHMELAADLSSETYLNVFKRFISRRGRPIEMHSDNGLNFVGAKRELDELYALLNDNAIKQKITDFMTCEKINWRFIPPRAPHIGGIWEAAVKSAKFHLKRIAGEASLKYDELFTLLVQVEAILNSRPLTPLSNDPNDLSVLTPGHFMVGCPLTAYPEPNFEAVPLNIRSSHK